MDSNIFDAVIEKFEHDIVDALASEYDFEGTDNYKESLVYFFDKKISLDDVDKTIKQQIEDKSVTKVLGAIHSFSIAAFIRITLYIASYDLIDSRDNRHSSMRFTHILLSSHSNTCVANSFSCLSSIS